MSELYNSIMTGLNEAISDAQSEKKYLRRRVIEVEPVKKYEAQEIKKIRTKVGLSQKLFAAFLGVSNKTVEAWEKGTNRPSGAASRILTMMEMDEGFIERFPFVKFGEKK